MKMALLLLLFASASAIAMEVKTLKLAPAARMQRAELHYLQTAPSPTAVLVLCPGSNGSAESQVRSSVWQEFARKNNLGLVGLSFASPMEAIHDSTGYYYASKGSGQKLLDGIRAIYGRELPLLLYGISGGAHFTSRFEEWKPEAVLAWCAYSAQWWDEPVRAGSMPPGIVACGEEDMRLGASLIYFKKGRALGKPWLWVCLPDTGHTSSGALDSFVRSYFESILSQRQSTGKIVDIDRKIYISESEARSFPSLSAWLPEESLFEPWNRLHEP